MSEEFVHVSRPLLSTLIVHTLVTSVVLLKDSCCVTMLLYFRFLQTTKIFLNPENSNTFTINERAHFGSFRN